MAALSRLLVKKLEIKVLARCRSTKAAVGPVVGLAATF